MKLHENKELFQDAITVTSQQKGIQEIYIVAIFLLPAPFIFQNNPFAIAQAIVGVILIFNAFSGMCVIYRFFGANTCKV